MPERKFDVDIRLPNSPPGGEFATTKDYVDGITGHEHSDTAANLASSNPVVSSGRTAFETDTLLVKYGNGTDNYNDLPYVGARELASAATITQQTGITGTTGSPTDITGLNISFDVVSRPVYVTFFHPYLVSVTNTATPFLRIRNVSDGVAVADGNTAMSTAGGQFFHGTLVKRISTPGSYNWKASVWRAGAGTLTSLNNTSNYEALLVAEEK